MAIIGPDGEVRCAGIEEIATIVVIYAENRSFDTLYGSFPSANGLSQIIAARYAQLNRDGSILRELPRCGMLAAKGVVAVVTQLDRIALRLKRVRRPHLMRHDLDSALYYKARHAAHTRRSNGVRSPPTAAPRAI